MPGCSLRNSRSRRVTTKFAISSLAVTRTEPESARRSAPIMLSSAFTSSSTRAAVAAMRSPSGVSRHPFRLRSKTSAPTAPSMWAIRRITVVWLTRAPDPRVARSRARYRENEAQVVPIEHEAHTAKTQNDLARMLIAINGGQPYVNGRAPTREMASSRSRRRRNSCRRLPRYDHSISSLDQSSVSAKLSRTTSPKTPPERSTNASPERPAARRCAGTILDAHLCVFNIDASENFGTHPCIVKSRPGIVDLSGSAGRRLCGRRKAAEPTIRIEESTMATPTSNFLGVTDINPALLGVGRYVGHGEKWGGGLGSWCDADLQLSRSRVLGAQQLRKSPTTSTNGQICRRFQMRNDLR